MLMTKIMYVYRNKDANVCAFLRERERERREREMRESEKREKENYPGA